MRNTKSLEFPEGNKKIALGRLGNKYAPNTASSLLKVKSKLHDSKLDWIEKDQDEWISHL